MTRGAANLVLRARQLSCEGGELAARLIDLLLLPPLDLQLMEG